jgi:hypothetical protein
MIVSDVLLLDSYVTLPTLFFWYITASCINHAPTQYYLHLVTVMLLFLLFF